MGLFLFTDASFSLRMGKFSNPVATHPRTNEVKVPPPPPGARGRPQILPAKLCRHQHNTVSL